MKKLVIQVFFDGSEKQQNKVGVEGKMRRPAKQKLKTFSFVYFIYMQMGGS
jgi:hypothetical protein